MIKTLSKARKQERVKFLIPRSVQDCIALVAGSAYGIFFAAESPDENAISVQEAVELLTEEYRDRLEKIENSVECDRQEIESNDGSYAIVWQDVLAVFASQTAGDANGTTVCLFERGQCRSAAHRSLGYERAGLAHRKPTPRGGTNK